MRKAKPYLAAAIIFFSVLATAIYLKNIYDELQKSEAKHHIAHIVNNQALLIGKRLSKSLKATYILAQEVRRTKGNVENFDQLAEQLIAEFGGITNLQLAPNAIIKKIYPLKGHEKAIGHDLLRDDDRRNAARIAIDTGLLTLAGPFKLMQGGVAVVGRNPVFLTEEGKQSFWGFTSALILLDELIAESDLDELEQEGYHYELSHIDPETDKKATFSNMTPPVGSISHSTSFNAPNHIWTLTLSIETQSQPFLKVIYFAFWTYLGFFMSVSSYSLLRQPEKLREVVKQRTIELEYANLKFKQLSETDPLTKIPNRRVFEERIAKEIKASRRSNQPLSLLIIDIDHFKQYNDLYGHDAGDVTLIRVAGVIRENLPRSTDLAARIGGEEFVVLMPSTDADGAYLVAERIRAHVKSLAIKHEYPDNIEMVTVSIGISTLTGDALNGDELFKQADTALYKAKDAGRNKCTIFK